MVKKVLITLLVLCTLIRITCCINKSHAVNTSELESVNNKIIDYFLNNSNDKLSIIFALIILMKKIKL